LYFRNINQDALSVNIALFVKSGNSAKILTGAGFEQDLEKWPHFGRAGAEIRYRLSINLIYNGGSPERAEF